MPTPLTQILSNWSDLPTWVSSHLPQQHAPFPNYFILYSATLTVQKIVSFQQKCDINFQIMHAWQCEQLVVVLLYGEWRTQWLDFAHEERLDIAPIHYTACLDRPGLLVMDMDSTMIQMECIDEIAKLVGVGAEVSAITERAMQGELDFSQSLRQRVATLKDAPESILAKVKSKLPLMPGLETMVKTLQQYGWKTAIASGGFTYFADHLKHQLQLDVAVSNQFDIQHGKLTGLVKGDIVDAQYKANTLIQLASQYQIPRENCIAIGDGANDLAMLDEAGLGVAFHAKPKVQQQAKIMIKFADLNALLCLLSANQYIKEKSYAII